MCKLAGQFFLHGLWGCCEKIWVPFLAFREFPAFREILKNAFRESLTCRELLKIFKGSEKMRGRKVKLTDDPKARKDQRERTKDVVKLTKNVAKLSKTPPKYFSEMAASVWKTIIPILQQIEAVKKTDFVIVEAFCTNYEIMVNAYKDIQEHGQTQAIFKTVQLSTGQVLKDADGKPRRDFLGYKRNPSTQIFDAATTKLKMLASELGLTPASRASLVNLLADKTDTPNIMDALNQFFD